MKEHIRDKQNIISNKSDIAHSVQAERFCFLIIDYEIFNTAYKYILPNYVYL
jgi:hypothetical protein